jgi:hypothetical protein
MKNTIFKLTMILVTMFTTFTNVKSQSTLAVNVTVEVFQDKKDPGNLLRNGASIFIGGAINVTNVDVYFIGKNGKKCPVTTYVNKTNEKYLILNGSNVLKNVKDLSMGKFVILVKDNQNIVQRFTSKKIVKKNDINTSLSYGDGIDTYELSTTGKVISKNDDNTSVKVCLLEYELTDPSDIDVIFGLDNTENIVEVRLFFIEKNGKKCLIKQYNENNIHQYITLDVRNITNMYEGKFVIELTDRQNNVHKYVTKRIPNQAQWMSGIKFKNGTYIYNSDVKKK